MSISKGRNFEVLLHQPPSRAPTHRQVAGTLNEAFTEAGRMIGQWEAGRSQGGGAMADASPFCVVRRLTGLAHGKPYKWRVWREAEADRLHHEQSDAVYDIHAGTGEMFPDPPELPADAPGPNLAAVLAVQQPEGSATVVRPVPQPA